MDLYEAYEVEYQAWADTWYEEEMVDRAYENAHCPDCAYDYERELHDRYETLYPPPSCDSRFCFCTDCCEAEDSGCGKDEPDYNEWQRAFPALPWAA